MKLLLVSVCLLLFAGCKLQSANKQRCGVTGQTAECACPGGLKGAQTCQADGTFAPCECPNEAQSAAASPSPKPAQPATATPSEPSARGAICDPAGRWILDDERTFEIARDKSGSWYVRNAMEGDDVEIHVADTNGVCDVMIRVVENAIAAGSGDYTRYTYELYGRGGKISGLMVACEFGLDSDVGDFMNAKCPDDQQTSRTIQGRREALTP